MTAKFPHIGHTRRPLSGKTILLTRPRSRSEESRPLFEAAGATVLIQPALEIVPTEGVSPRDAVIFDDLARFDHVIFSSAAGVEFFLRRLAKLQVGDGRDRMAILATKRLIAVGPGTAAELAKAGLSADYPAERHSAEGVVDFLAKEARAGKRFLSIRGDRGRGVLKEGLTALGGIFEEIAVYRSVDVPTPDERIARLLEEGKIDVVTVTSPATASGVFRLFGDALKKTKTASISPLTTDALSCLGFSPDMEASEATLPGILAAILRYYSQS